MELIRVIYIIFVGEVSYRLTDKNFSGRCLNRIKMISAEIVTAEEVADAAAANQESSETADGN